MHFPASFIARNSHIIMANVCEKTMVYVNFKRKNQALSYLSPFPPAEMQYTEDILEHMDKRIPQVR